MKRYSTSKNSLKDDRDIEFEPNTDSIFYNLMFRHENDLLTKDLFNRQSSSISDQSRSREDFNKMFAVKIIHHVSYNRVFIFG